jgi:hypothetical protein
VLIAEIGYYRSAEFWEAVITNVFCKEVALASCR